MNGKYILDGHEPKQADLITWAKWFETADRKVAGTGKDNISVSTVFLGLDHRFGGNGPPLLFETMVFGGVHDGDMDRYSTWDKAIEGHRLMCDKVFGKED